jgi:hypothetical protein
MPALRYPLNELDTDVKTTRIKFTASETGKTVNVGSVMLYMPQGVSFGDQANYGTFEMGALGGAIQRKIIDEIKNEIDASGESVGAWQFGKRIASKLASNATDSIKGQFSSLDSSISGIASGFGNLSTYLSRQIAPQNIQDMIRYNTKQVLNPNTHTLFNNVEVRTFSFSFRMIAESFEESRAIMIINNFFREYMYPEVTQSPGFLTKFPVTWDIKFLYGTGSTYEENHWIPKIHKTFLTSFNTTYNNEANSFHKQGEPYDVSVSMSFMETKAYDRATILGGDAAASEAMENETPADGNPNTPPMEVPSDDDVTNIIINDPLNPIRTPGINPLP